jgi:hypothetical protein
MPPIPRSPMTLKRRWKIARASISLLFLLLISIHTHAQISVSGTSAPSNAQPKQVEEQRSVAVRVAAGELPPSRLYDYIERSSVTTYRLPPLSESEINQRTDATKRLQIGLVRTLPDPLSTSRGTTSFDLPDERQLNIAAFVSEGARQVRLHFTEVDIPVGGRLFIYSAGNRDEVYGPYDGRGPFGDGEFWTPPVEGESVIIEYVAPRAATDMQLPFRVTQVNHTYLNPKEISSSVQPLAAGACNLSIPPEWSTVARSVGRLQFVSGSGEYVCTGTLLNSLNNDLTPYLLTANHCISTQEEAQSARVLWFYDSPQAQTLYSDRTTLLSTGAATDYTLLMVEGSLSVNSLPLSNFRWAGWTTATPAISTDVTAIHHPDGDFKRVSFGSIINSSCSSGLPGPCDNFLSVRWNSGTTEPGSSGSAIWAGNSADPLIVGTLWGGAASCGNPSGTDYYGRFGLTYNSIANFLEGGSDDRFEDNDTRQTATTITPGTSANGLIIKSVDEDWYRISVPAGSTFTFNTVFNRNNGDIDLQLFRGTDANPIRTSSNFNNFEAVGEVNTTGGTVDYYVRVYIVADTRNTYSIELTMQNCTYTVAPTTLQVPWYTALHSVFITAPGGCNGAWTANSNANWIVVSPNSRTGNGGGSVLFNVTDNDSPAPRTGSLTVFGQTITITQEGRSCWYTVTPTSSSFNQPGGGSRISVTTSTSACNSWSATSDVDWITINAVNNNNGSNVGYVDYSVAANTAAGSRTGRLTIAGTTIQVTQFGTDAPPPTIQFAWAPIPMVEWSGRMTLTVMRTGGTAQAASVDYMTSDTSGAAGCGVVTGAASARCDYVAASGTLRFATGQSHADINISLIDDTHVEGSEALTITLSNAVGATLNTSSSTAALTISDNDTNPNAANPTDNIDFFVRQHYLDFLDREPEPGGFAYWTSVLRGCNGDSNCLNRVRVEISSRFFAELEFQRTGYYVMRLWRASSGEFPNYQQFITDRRQVQNNETSQRSFAAQFVQRSEFLARYPASLSASEFVTQLYNTAGANSFVNERQAHVTALQSGQKTRAEVLHEVVNLSMFSERTVVYNTAWVRMQYFGYLRRDAEVDGETYWRRVITELSPNNYTSMICAFLNSREYHERFASRRSQFIESSCSW